MNLRRWTAPILTLLAIAGVLLAGALETTVAHAAGSLDLPVADHFWPLSWLGLPIVGSLIVMMRPENRVGWTMVGVGAGVGLTLATTAYARWAFVVAPGAPLAEFAGWLAAWVPVPAFGLLAILILIFPTGRTTTTFTRRVARLTTAALAALTLWQAVTPVTVAGGFANAPKFTNPWSIVALGGIADLVTTLLAQVVMLLSLLVIVSLPLRLRRAGGVERQQLKAFVFAVSVVPVMFGSAIAITSVSFSEQGDAVVIVGSFVLMFNGLAASIAVAVFKYRLYEVDLIINRTLVYGALTAVLVGAYALGVLIFRTVLDPVTGDNDIAIAASTLAVAALFGPARRKIQAFIDRRFYRSRYDAQQTLESFARRLRDEVDIDALSVQLLDVVADTVQPRHASVWLAKEAAR